MSEVFGAFGTSLENPRERFIRTPRRTNNRIRSPRLAAFGRTATRRVREVGKFGPYLRYKDWLRRRLLETSLFYCTF